MDKKKTKNTRLKNNIKLKKKQSLISNDINVEW